MSKRAVLMMTFGSPEEITYEGVAEFFTNIRRGVRPEPHEIQTLYDHYLRIGGTPLQRITKKKLTWLLPLLENKCRLTLQINFPDLSSLMRLKRWRMTELKSVCV